MMAQCAFDGCNRDSKTAGLCGMHYLRKWRNGDPSTKRSNANGEGGISSQGYRIITVSGRRVAEHIHICEKAIGKTLPKGAEIHHVNEVKHDNRPENLVICGSAKYHQLLHARQKAMDECGDPNKLRCRYCGFYDDPENIVLGKGCVGSGHHRACRQINRRIKGTK